LKTLCTDGPNVVSGAKEDAGIVSVATDNQGLRYCVAISHESHNHPSQVVPFEGAATGIGGNVRDVSCMGAEVIANADSLRFGESSHPLSQWIADEAVKGIASYSNAIGVPNITGDIYFHAGFNDNCLVTVVSLGILREDHVIHSCAPKNSKDSVFILVGKPTDNSGFGGASFASIDLNEDNVEHNRAAVQEPNAFLGRLLLKANHDLFLTLQKMNAIARVGLKDLGAGGIACASVEMAESGGVGADIFLENVAVSMHHLDPSVILCAETQERYLWAVPPDLVDVVLDHYNKKWQLPLISAGAVATVIGNVREDGRYVVHYRNEILIDARAKDITQGILYDRAIKKPEKNSVKVHRTETVSRETEQRVFEQYDKQVQGRTIIERGQADAGVFQPFNSDEYPAEIQSTGIALSVACDPNHGVQDAYWTAVNAIVNAVCKVVAVGATPWALTDCLCFGNPENPEQMYELVSTIRGLKDAAEQIGLLDFENTPLPIVAGNVSLYNQNKAGKAIPASPMISCLGRMDDVNTHITPARKRENSTLIFLGAENIDDGNDQLPKPNLKQLRESLREFFRLHREGRILSAKQITNGVLAEIT
ncbi:MAG TPA: AIR synthase related protein, partial [Coxiellaceae bacterium]|nr:AIR synthase related protein [Coxiellaceae bacterium]